ncbi:MAG TPA: HlyD family efflux transporter periplasmic adaptor subunit [Albitalea sp.]
MQPATLTPSARHAPPDAGPARRGGPGSGAALVLHARALRHERFAPAAAAVLDGLVLLVGCERASLGLHLRGRMQVVATSTGADTSQRTRFTDALAAAMQEAVDQGAPIVRPLPPGSTPAVGFAHGELERLNGGLALCTVPIVGADRVIGAFLLEQRGGFDAASLKLAKDAALFVGPVLDLKHRVEAPVGGRLLEAVAPRGVRLGDRRMPAWRLGLAAAAVAVLAAALWPVTFRVVAPARVEGVEQRILAAPVDGFIASVAARPGATVRTGEVLAALEDRDLMLQRDRHAAEIGQLDKQYREALTGDDAARIVIARAALEQARAQHALAERELDRATLRAPFDGVVVAGDLASLVGSPVTRGQALMTVSPGLGFKVVAEVEDQDIAALAPGQRARVLFAGLGQAPVDFTVTRIAPAAVMLDQRNVFEVEGRVDAGAAAALRPGLRGVARIDVDRRLQAEVWWLRLGHWLRRTTWQLMG